LWGSRLVGSQQIGQGVKITDEMLSLPDYFLDGLVYAKKRSIENSVDGILIQERLGNKYRGHFLLEQLG